jgi:ribosomal protein L37E
MVSFHQHQKKESAMEKMATVPCTRCQREITDHEINFCSHCGLAIAAWQKQYLKYHAARQEATIQEQRRLGNRFLVFPLFLELAALFIFAILVANHRLTSVVALIGDRAWMIPLVALATIFIISGLTLFFVPRLSEKYAHKTFPPRTMESFQREFPR